MRRYKKYETIINKGDRYGYLVLTGEFEKKSNSHFYVECICDCGEIIKKRFDGLINNTTKSCGSKECKKLSQELPLVVGQRFGRFILTGIEKYEKGKRCVEVLCDCGNIGFWPLTSLRSGRTKSCGCFHADVMRAITTTHGHTINKITHPIYNTWSGIKQRCTNIECESYERYGGRGISIFAEWYLDFYKFYEWSINNGWEEGLTLDRIDNDKNYEPSNCRWTTSEVQNRNKSNTVNITAFGETKCATDWVNDSRCSISFMGLTKRIKKGWNHELAITTKAKGGRKRLKAA